MQQAGTDERDPAGGRRRRGLQPHRRHRLGRARGRPRAAAARVLLPGPPERREHVQAPGRSASPTRRRCAGATTSSSIRRRSRRRCGARSRPTGGCCGPRPGDDLLAYRIARDQAPPTRPRPARRCGPCAGWSAPCRRAASRARLRRPAAATSPDAGRDHFQVWSVDLRNGSRRLEIERQVVGESEGLDGARARRRAALDHHSVHDQRPPADVREGAQHAAQLRADGQARSSLG